MQVNMGRKVWAVRGVVPGRRAETVEKKKDRKLR